MTAKLTTIGFDADDTLWHSQGMFDLSEEKFATMLSGYGDPASIAAKLREVERRNLDFNGFGVKSFTLSLIETAIEVTEGRVGTDTISEILALGRAMLRNPVETLPGVQEALRALAGSYRFILITKGDLLDQERKLAASGLGELFDAVEIVSNKSADTYRRAFTRHGDGPEAAMMVGNSLKSDVLPALDAGAWAVHIPYHSTWALEHADAPENHPRFFALESLEGLSALVEGIAADIASGAVRE